MRVVVVVVVVGRCFCSISLMLFSLVVVFSMQSVAMFFVVVLRVIVSEPIWFGSSEPRCITAVPDSQRTASARGGW